MKIYHFIHRPTGIILGDVRVTVSGMTSIYAERTLTKDEKELLNRYVALHLYEVLQDDLKHMLQKGTSFFDITKYYVGDFYFKEVL